MDFVISVSELPQIGESKNGHSFLKNQGGKGANQAIACKKLGGDRVYLIAAVGNDDNGRDLINALKKYRINTDMIKIKDDTISGVCMIILDESQQDNLLIIDRGANNNINPSDFIEFLRKNASKDDLFITQLEISLEAVYKGLKVAKEIGMYTILNPAPVTEIDNQCLKNVDLIVPNETETQLLTGIDIKNDIDLMAVYEYFSTKGVKEVLVTLGSKGSAYLSDNTFIKCQAEKVKVVDTTSAGDTFIGAIALRKAKGYDVKESLDFASKAAAITVSRKGAAVSIPTEKEVQLTFKN